VWARFSAPVQTGPEAHPTYCTMGTVSFPGVIFGRFVTLTSYPVPVPRSKKSRAIPLLSRRVHVAYKRFKLINVYTFYKYVDFRDI